MLRVYSILYLEKVWTRPRAKPRVVVRAPSPANSAFIVEQIIIDSDSIGSEVEPTEQTSYGTVDIVSIQEEEQSEEAQALLKIEQDLLRKEKEREQERQKLEEEQWQLEQEKQKNEKRLKELQLKQKDKQRLQERIIDQQLLQEHQISPEQLKQEHTKQEGIKKDKDDEEEEVERYSTHSTPTPSTTMGDLSCSNSSMNLNDKQISCMPLETPIHPYSPVISTRDRDYYDDDISSDNEHIIDQLPTPPSTPNKFSPKRILHRAKSSINDESVRNLGRRTSQFLEKKFTSPTATATTTTTTTTTTTAADEFSIKSLRRQSSKLSVKGKTFGKKLKRVLSFQQTS
ncbi:hypothetical protein HPULCUR_001268 [Helicostylum pulchrum]|uniref:Uncharacterized protein n=1 Tax=Helicostylum pulchrum TaxID=562976 RepID=A0ABP9XMC3_9FUNG